ncbi:lytic transglycosylase domain-containing protein [Nocardia altamirensis]|uniref:aggregation-promoting factor C-terminal-like domain-containing protein n=1 Tax=Nocardia altamirensis TaxID=472158 RepID=UPI000B0B34F5|nr:lytic transglycosylase domain-containing protein [Nocardia altamirensis]
MRYVIPTIAAAVCAVFLGMAPAHAVATDCHAPDAPAICAKPSALTNAYSAGSTLSIPKATVRAIAMGIVPPHHFWAFDNIITRESSWNVFARNPESGAYGLGQALPPEKMSTHGLDWPFNPVTQIRWTYDYMNKRYGSPIGAWEFWQAHHWY